MTDRFEVRAYYGRNDNEHRCLPGDMAFLSVSSCQRAHQREIAAAMGRPEIGRVETRVLRDWEPWQVVFERGAA